MDWEMEWGTNTIWDGIWVFGICAVILWAMYRAHMRSCEETPQPDAQPGAADEIASRAEMLAQLMKQTGSPPAASAPPSGDR